MKGYTVHLRLLAPTMIGSGPARGNHVDCLRYVPGGTIRGALAQRWIIEHGTPDTVDDEMRQEFGAIFESSLSFGPTHVVGSRIRGLSELYPKYGSLKENESIIDLATDEPPQRPLEYEPGKGQVDGVDVIDVARTALDDNERARDGQLYSREALPAGLHMTGTISGRHEWLDGICGMPIRVRLGGRRSVNGSAELRLEPVEAGTYQPQADTIVVRAISPVILLDHACRPVAKFTSEAFADALNCSTDEITIDGSWVRTDVVHGWHVASGLPKPDDLALTIGSTAVVCVPHHVDLNQLEYVGIGARTAEGFGRLVVNPAGSSAHGVGDRASAERAPGLEAFTRLAQHWCGMTPDRVSRLLRSALERQSAREQVTLEDLVGRAAQRALVEAYENEFNDIVHELSLAELDDLIALVDAEAIRRGEVR